jgi:hypothetical protein
MTHWLTGLLSINCSTTSGVTVGPEIIEIVDDVESMDKEPENDIEFFGANDGYAVNSFGG